MTVNETATRHCCSLVPRPPPFSSLVCLQYNTRGGRHSEKQGRPGLVHHVSGRMCEVDIGGGADIQICIE